MTIALVIRLDLGPSGESNLKNGSSDFSSPSLFPGPPNRLARRILVLEARSAQQRIDVQDASLHAVSMLRARKPAPLMEDSTALLSESKNADVSTDLDDSARAALGGDPLALRKFLRSVAPIVRRVCRGVMGRENPELEDAIQDCLIDIARALPHFRFEGSVSHYVKTIVMRRAIALRQRQRTRSKQHADMDLASLSSASVDDSSEGRAELMGNLLEELNEVQAKALLLRIMLGHSIDEIASITGVSVNTVKTRLRLAKNQLRRWLVRSGEGRRAGG